MKTRARPARARAAFKRPRVTAAPTGERGGGEQLLDARGRSSRNGEARDRGTVAQVIARGTCAGGCDTGVASGVVDFCACRLLPTRRRHRRRRRRRARNKAPHRDSRPRALTSVGRPKTRRRLPTRIPIQRSRRSSPRLPASSPANARPSSRRTRPNFELKKTRPALLCSRALATHPRAPPLAPDSCEQTVHPHASAAGQPRARRARRARAEPLPSLDRRPF